MQEVIIWIILVWGDFAEYVVRENFAETMWLISWRICLA